MVASTTALEAAYETCRDVTEPLASFCSRQISDEEGDVARRRPSEIRQDEVEETCKKDWSSALMSAVDRNDADASLSCCRAELRCMSTGLLRLVSGIVHEGREAAAAYLGEKAAPPKARTTPSGLGRHSQAHGRSPRPTRSEVANARTPSVAAAGDGRRAVESS